MAAAPLPNPAPAPASPRRAGTPPAPLLVSAMAAGAGAGADKENAAPSTSKAAAGAGPRRHGYGVRSCGVKKRPSRARLQQGRVPLRDITNLIAATSATTEVPEVPLGQEVSPAPAPELLAKPDAVARVAAVQDGAAGGAAAKKAPAAARYSLRKEFR